MTATADYRAFLDRKSQLGGGSGFSPVFMPACLFDFQRFLVEWAVRRGRAATLADTGLGKTLLELTWAENVARHTVRPVLIMTPLAVSYQTAREAAKFGIEAKVSRDGRITSPITITNYERLHYFNADDFAGASGDEIQAIKAFDGKRRKQVTRFLSKMQFRSLATATPAPNDFVELGTISEALGELTQSEMLSLFFRSSDNMRHRLFKEGDYWNRPKWFFRTHAEIPFWRWVCSWGRAVRKPEDLGFDGSRFVLPPLTTTQYVIDKTFIPPGEMFPVVARTLKEQRQERKWTLRERCEKVAELVDHNEPAVVWCQYNAEGDLLEELIKGSVQVAGRHTDEEKEDRLKAFSFGQVRVLVTKEKIGCLGLNWQHCGHQAGAIVRQRRNCRAWDGGSGGSGRKTNETARRRQSEPAA